MPNNTDSQEKRRKDTIQGTVITTLLLLAQGLAILILRNVFRVTGFWGAVLLILSVLELGSILPIWILLKQRLKEIQGGEENAAAQY